MRRVARIRSIEPVAEPDVPNRSYSSALNLERVSRFPFPCAETLRDSPRFWSRSAAHVSFASEITEADWNTKCSRPCTSFMPSIRNWLARSAL